MQDRISKIRVLASLGLDLLMKDVAIQSLLEDVLDAHKGLLILEL